MLEKILGALLPAVITVLLGYFAARHHDFKQKEVPTLNRMVMGYALPILLFIGAVSADRSELVKDVVLLIVLAVAFIGMYGAIFLLCRLAFRFSLGESALSAFTAAAPSTGFVGPAVLGHLYGEASGIPIALGSIIIIATMLPLTIVLLSLDASENEAERERLHLHQASPSRARADPPHA
jgi:predicted permease